ncbi:MAG: hypothetical protein M3N54_06980 [Acidobacteriota bacterium]|nr:hypothetical protein [Acidobacteriota bacterium]
MRASLSMLFLSCISLHASMLPTLHLDAPTVKAFQDYVANYEKTVQAQFLSSGKVWIDEVKRGGFESGKAIVEPRENADVANGSIHHFTGAIRVKGGTIDAVQHIMEDYPNYPRYFTPDVARAVGTKEADSKPGDDHYKGELILVQTTLWINITFDTVYDTHYRRLDKDRWVSRSVASSIKEMREAGNPREGFFPEGEDHGFLWKTHTYWYARERDGGLDLVADSISLSRPNIPGFGWWGTRRSKDAVEKMLRDLKTAVESGAR